MADMNLEAIQAALREAGHDGWLFYDHHHRDPIGGRILGLDELNWQFNFSGCEVIFNT